MANMKDNLVLNEDTLKMAFQHFDIVIRYIYIYI